MATIWCVAVGLSCWCVFPSTAAAPARHPPEVLFRESFDDAGLLKRGWYDGSTFTISGTQPYAGKGCIEYRWRTDTTTPVSSSGVRRLFAPTDTVYLRCYLRLSKGWGWTGRPYHPHLITS
jgi:hypothetical protein